MTLLVLNILPFPRAKLNIFALIYAFDQLLSFVNISVERVLHFIYMLDMWV